MQPPIPNGTILQSRYRLINLLGQGGFGRTYLVEDQGRFNEPCALKELNPPQTGEYALGKSKELFQREAQILYQIEHPQIPKFRAMFEESQRIFFVQDFVEGQTYRTILEERKGRGFVFAEKEIVTLLKQMLPVLTYLHGKGIIHRDIAPDNIIQRDRDQLPVLIDFGVVKELATRIQPIETVKQQATTVGKLGYAPTEQMQTGNAYPNSDLYALAVSCVVLLTGREPQELLDSSSMTWTWQRWCQVTPGFAQIINRMLSYQPAQRYQSAAEVDRALQLLENPGVPQTIAPDSQATQAPVKAAIPSQMATVAVGRDYDVPPDERQRPVSGKRSPAAIPDRKTLWDDPWSVGLIGMGMVGLAAIGTYAVTNALKAKPPIVESPPVVITTDTPSPKPTTTPKPKPSEPPKEFSQKLTLTPGKTVNKSDTLAENQILAYTFAGQEGQKLAAVLSGDSAIMSIVGPNGEALPRAKRTFDWEGELPFTGEYAVRIRSDNDAKKAAFKLDLTLQDPPKPTPTPTPTETPTSTPTPDPNIKTERILFEAGQTGTQVKATVKQPEVIRYVVAAKAGQTLDVSLDGGASLSMLNPNGKPIPDANGLSSWRALLPDGGDYIIEVNAKDSFKLNVEVK